MGKQYLNGVLYGTGEIIKFSPYIYSLEEREIGVWTDGKPLYQKTVCYTATSRTDNSIDVSALSIDTMADINCKFVSNGGTNFFGNVNDSTNSYHVIFNYSSGSITLESNGAEWYPISYEFTLQYTKSTDLPGSGHYTTTGDKANHYSTTEHVIGTWVDGSTIYEKSFEITLPPSYDAPGGFLIENDATYINAIISFNGTVKAANGLIVGSGIDASGWRFAIHRNPDSQLLLYTSNDGANMYGGIAYVTIQYTKITT